MARTSVTEESLGLAPSEDELAYSPPAEDDVPLDNEPEAALAPAKPGGDKAKAADAAPDTPPADQAKAAEPTLVDVRALQEARAEAREAKSRAAVLEQRWNDFLSGQNTKQPQAEAPAKPQMPGEDDPMARINWTVEQVAAMRQEQEQRTAAEQRQLAERQQVEAAIEVAREQFSEREAADPSVRQAYDALKGSYAAELQALGYPAHVIPAELAKIEAQGIQYALSRGLHVADYITGLAKARGWQAQAAAAPQAIVPAKPDLAALAATQQRHQSLSDAPGGEIVAPLDAKSLAKMTDKQFKAWMSKKGNEQKFDEIMGAG